MASCIHWIPGWWRSDKDPQDLFERLCRDTDCYFEQKIEAVQTQADDGPGFQESELAEVLRLTEQHKNLSQMQLDLWSDFNIISKGTEGNGSCGVEMLASFAENTAAAGIDGQQASNMDLMDIYRAYRTELSEMWTGVSQDPLWQKILQYFIVGRCDLSKWRVWSSPSPKATPSPKKGHPDAKETPPKEFQHPPRKGGLLDDGEAGIEAVVCSALVEGSGEEPPKKKKRTGKSRDPTMVINFERYLKKTLGEKGLTYRHWTQAHHETSNLVFLDCGILC